MSAAGPGAPRAGTLVTLLAGRGAYRAALYASGLILLALWGPVEFARYAVATGAVAWLALLVASGQEKAALALIPRPGGACLERLFVTLAATPSVASAAVWAALAAGGATAAARYAAAAALTTGVGGTTVLVGLYRLRGTPRADTIAFGCLTAGYGTATGLVAATGLGVDAVLGVLVGTVAAVNLALLAGLVRRLPGTRPSRVDTTAALRAAAILGAGELLSGAAVSVLYAMFAATGDARATGWFYLMTMVSAIGSAGWSYLLRIAAPRVVSWLVRTGPAAGWLRAGRILGAALLAGALAAGGLAAAAVLGAPTTPLLVLAVGLELVLFSAFTAGAMILENVDAGGRRWSAGGALVQFLTVAATGWWLVPMAGALGGFGALVAGELIKAALLWRVARGRTGRPGRPVLVPAAGGDPS